ncbi:hypothetical protein HX776_24070 [Pseudomonas agarici]|uniref:hypothetical protein n=1 Tax=Pseudomonas agarici TaxID=46677 RepID=UPI0002FBA504|nr:hypothetical protein [Pseudomonas agarici]NWC11866.1 hypothetical protein [Pseudomonas agarici]SEL86173.1 hypothetical protein SAMN05216604_1418 [Pseudomonas agarici]
MEKVFEVSVDGGNRVETVKGVRAYVDCGVLHIEDADGQNVAIFAEFDYLITKPATQD